GLRLRDSHTGLKTTDEINEVVVARGEVVVFGERDRRPEFDFGKVVEERHAARHHARDRVSLAAESDLATNNILSAAEPSLPEFVTQQHDAMTAELLFFVCE